VCGHWVGALPQEIESAIGQAKEFEHDLNEANATTGVDGLWAASIGFVGLERALGLPAASIGFAYRERALALPSLLLWLRLFGFFYRLVETCKDLSSSRFCGWADVFA
jgi:hypothetical protein